MNKEIRTVVYDDELRIEAYRFEGIVQPFPNHFHEYYVIGFMEKENAAFPVKIKSMSLRKAILSFSTLGTIIPVSRAMRGRWITGALISPKRSCWIWPRKSPANGSCPDSSKT